MGALTSQERKDNVNTRTTEEPTLKQTRFVDGLLAGLTITEAAKAAECSRMAWYGRWRHDQSFMEYLEMRRHSEASAKLPTVDNAVFDKAMTGNVQAARLVYEVFGHLRTGAQATVQVRNEQYDLSGLSKEELRSEAIKIADELQKMVGTGFSEPESVVPMRRP